MPWLFVVGVVVPLWICAIGIVTLALRNRTLRRRPGNVSVRLRSAPGKRWARGNAVWINDVFAFRGAPAAWSEVVAWVSTAGMRHPSGDDEHKLRRLDRPVIATFTVRGGGAIQVAAPKAQRDLLLGPFSRESSPLDT
jgi:hypothetical protein